MSSSPPETVNATPPDAWGDANPHLEAAQAEESAALEAAVQRFTMTYLQDRVVRLNATMREMAEEQLRATMDTPKAVPDLDPENGSPS